MNDDLLEALGRVAREERAEANREVDRAPPLPEGLRERMVSGALTEIGVSSAPSSRRARRAILASGLALAAAIALWAGARHETLPGYTLSVRGGTTEWRTTTEDASADRVEVRADGSVEILVRPEAPPSRSVQARAFAVRDDATTRDLPVEVSTQGVARVAGRVDALLGTTTSRSEWQVVVVIGPAGEVPATVGEARARSGLRIVETRIVMTQ